MKLFLVHCSRHRGPMDCIWFRLSLRLLSGADCLVWFYELFHMSGLITLLVSVVGLVMMVTIAVMMVVLMIVAMFMAVLMSVPPMTSDRLMLLLSLLMHPGMNVVLAFNAVTVTVVVVVVVLAVNSCGTPYVVSQFILLTVLIICFVSQRRARTRM